MHYLRRGFQKLREYTVSNVYEEFCRIHKHSSIINIASDPSVGNLIVVFVSNDSANLPSTFKGYKVLKYNVRKALDKCDELLQRIEDENVDIRDPQNMYFYELLFSGRNICYDMINGSV